MAKLRPEMEALQASVKNTGNMYISLFIISSFEYAR
jgi:hypothetical protein